MALLLRYLYILIAIVPFHIFVMQSSLPRRLHEAIASGNLDQLQSLLALSADPNVIYCGRTALQCAVVYKNPAIIRYLISSGAHLSHDILERFLKSGNEQYTAQYLLASLKILLAAGATKEHLTISSGYLTPVMLAHGNSEALHMRVIEMIQGYGKQKIA